MSFGKNLGKRDFDPSFLLFVKVRGSDKISPFRTSVLFYPPNLGLMC